MPWRTVSRDRTFKTNAWTMSSQLRSGELCRLLSIANMTSFVQRVIGKYRCTIAWNAPLRTVRLQHRRRAHLMQTRKNMRTCRSSLPSLSRRSIELSATRSSTTSFLRPKRRSTRRSSVASFRIGSISLHTANRQLHLLPLALVFAVRAGLASTDPFDGPNCHIAEPPAEAGDIFGGSAKASVAGKVFPRLSDLPANYSGCQVLWSTINNGPWYRSRLAVRNGRVEAVQPSPPVPLCAEGERTIDTGCSPRQRALIVSFPPGCAKRTVETGAVPGDCIKEFQREFLIHDKLVE